MAGGSTRVVVATLLGNAAIAAAKFAAAAATGSSAMFAEAVHSTVDTGNQILLLTGLQRAARPADARHPFGHRKELHFWAFVVAILLFGVGAGVSIHEGLVKLRNPHPITAVGWNYLVIAGAAAFEAGAWIVAWRAFDRERAGAPVLKALRQSKDPALFTVLFEDSAALLGLAAAFLGVLASDRLGWLRADAVATIAIGGILACAAILLAIETRSLLIGEAASPALVEDIIGTAGRAAFVEAVNEVRTLHFGPGDVLVNLSVDARDAMPAGEVERGISRLEDEIRARHPEVSRVFIEIQAAKASAEEIAAGDTGAGGASRPGSPEGGRGMTDADRAQGIAAKAAGPGTIAPAGGNEGGDPVTHRSRLAGVIIDCRTDAAGLDAAADFWAAALGAPRRPPERTYVPLEDQAGLHVEVQAVDHPPRVHLDIESDDIPAEVARLERLGARVVARIETWVVMEAPTGQRFCVIRAQTADFDKAAHTWPDPPVDP